MSPRDAKRRRLLTQDERVLWNTFTRAIAPMRASPHPAVDSEPEAAEMTALAQPSNDVPQDTFQHLMVAQDTGSAIRGVTRADIYFGHGEDIPHIAGRIKQWGKFVMLVPKDVTVRGEPIPATPLPRPRPKEIAIHEAMAKSKPAIPDTAPDRPAMPASKNR